MMSGTGRTALADINGMSVADLMNDAPAAPVAASGAQTPDQVRERLRAWLAAAPGRTQGTVERGTRIARSRISQFLNGKYDQIGGSDTETATIIEQFLDREEYGAVFRLKLKPVESPCYRSTVSVLETAKYSGDLAVISGPPGCGKTFAAETYAGTDPRYCLTLNIHDGMGSPQGFIAMLRARLTGADRLGYGYVERMIDEVAAILKSRPRFLILNDAQKLDFKVFDLCCYLSEECGVGIAFVGHTLLNSLIRAKTMRDHEAFDRVADRSIFLDVDHMPDPDWVGQVARQILPTIDEEAVEFLANKIAFDSLRKIVITCKLARKALASGRAKADARLIRRALAMKQPGI